MPPRHKRDITNSLKLIKPFQGNIWQQILSFHFILELVTTIPFALTVGSSLNP